MGKDFLKIIVAHKKLEVERLKQKIPESVLRLKSESKRNIRPFFDNLKQPGEKGINIIAEIKKASPSKGDICPDLNPEKVANDYEKGGAMALSVLTDENYFKGGFDDFIMAREHTTLPMLRKDFIISTYQVYESYLLGADAILLIARILTKQELKNLLALSRELKMNALVEINSEKDFENASFAGARLIGINNRNLSSFETNLGTATTLVESLDHDQIPVAASGISKKEDIIQNLKSGINNFLIGESLAKSDNTVSFLKSLIRS